MVLTSNDGFLTGLTKLFQTSKTTGTVWITMKKYNGSTKPTPRLSKKGMATSTKGGGASSDHEDNLCLLRATNGKKKISTVVSAREVTRFQMAYGNLLKAHLDGLKKRDKKSATTGHKKSKQ